MREKKLIITHNHIILNIIMENCAICLTAGEQSENHVGMQVNGNGLSQKGFSISDLENFKRILESKNIDSELFRFDQNTTNNGLGEYEDLEPAGVLIIRNSIFELIDETTDDMLEEQKSFEWDKKYWERKAKKVLNKRARYNVCFGENSQEPDYENKKGTIISYSDVPILSKWRDTIGELFGSNATNLEVEGNLYFDVKSCGIGFHGDSERKKVIACSLGKSRPIHWQWYYNYNPIGNRFIFQLNHGDMYIMSEKATGHDWKCKSKKTLRHAAGIKYVK